MASLGFADAASTGRPGYHPAPMLKLYIYGYLSQVQSSDAWNTRRGATSS